MKIKGFVFGIRVKKSFAIEDKLGAIIDDILNHPNKMFNADTFPIVRQSFGTKVLTNEIHNNTLSINPEGIILDINHIESFDEEFNDYLDAFEEIIVHDIFQKYKLRKINRLGFMIKSDSHESDGFLNSMLHQLQETYENPQSFSLRFNITTKLPLKIGKIITQDYANKILTYDRPNDETPFTISVDYQKYFVPPLNIMSDMKQNPTKSFKRHCETSLKDYKETYYKDGKFKEKAS